ncbi:hypothetical protein ACVIHI_001960 [Bradyrhizobium sp. USDA 4524]|uniref:hypothetical protein n=1 Tax=Bradyrhizobium TaxID=374 RepID=UPI00209DCD70|nr:MULTISPECIES: hypothetical protein [Bradyrhizobium]MCP1845118.1 hypothetical protein [Bradyrhizobium sp. USDA 4538]MCP1905683.1 hypothetical protein [Bradyrhizobium sp. USDA 4537]MCP1988661.1 hypothetical protein [Bradyrhizobium sp. USDA 4539]MCP3418424.1 hypothetical protein [Bradyrhizobium brasilense]
MNKDALISRLAVEIDEVSDHSAALSDEERQRKMAELSASRLAAQRLEAELTWRTMHDGAAIIPRADLAPAAVLGVKLVSAAPAVPREDEGQAGIVHRVGP